MIVSNRLRSGRPTGEPLLTPMIDVVFLLLVFFLLTFKIVSPEGDFNVKMPREAVDPLRAGTDLVPLTVYLRAGVGGQLADIRFGRRSLGNDFQALRSEMRRWMDEGLADARTTPVKLDCDYHLKYEYLIEAVTAVSGYTDRGQVVTLASKIELAPARVR